MPPRKRGARRADPARPRGLRRHPIVSSWRPERVSVSSPAAWAIATPSRGAQTGSTLGPAPAIRLDRDVLEQRAAILGSSGTPQRSTKGKPRTRRRPTPTGRRPGAALSEGVACVPVARRAPLRNGTVAPVPACFLTGDSHEERSSEGTLTEEHRQYWGCGLRPATGRAAFQG